MARRFSDAYEEFEEEQMERLHSCGTPLAILLSFWLVLFLYSLMPSRIFLGILGILAIALTGWFLQL